MITGRLRKLAARYRTSLSVHIIGPIVLEILFLGVVLGEIGIISHTVAFHRQYVDATRRIASGAEMFVNGDNFASYLDGRNEEEYLRSKEALDEYCGITGVSTIYIIMVDTDDYGSFVSIFNPINEDIVGGIYTEWQLGFQRNTTNDEYADKYRSIYEEGSSFESVLRLNPPDGKPSHLTVMVPVIDSANRVVAICCVQRPIEELRRAVMPFLLMIGIVTMLVALFVVRHTAGFVKTMVVDPIKRISTEATRFAKERNRREPIGTVSRMKQLQNLADAVNDMETDIIEYVDDIAAITKERERIETELSLAAKIQSDMLVSDWPVFPDRSEFSLHASMTPAKEVGGDFYNFFLIDKDHLCLMIADVSDKGIAAALFMVASSIILANNAKPGLRPAQILSDANRMICANNREYMFVTVWLGILEIPTGVITCVNAGHEYPLILRAQGGCQRIEDEHGLCVGIMEDEEYKDYELRLLPGDRLFVYTDGLTDATDREGEAFGMERVMASLSGCKKEGAQTVIEHMKKTVADFVQGGAPFDDLTMLCMEYKGGENVN